MLLLCCSSFDHVYDVDTHNTNVCKSVYAAYMYMYICMYAFNFSYA